MPKITMEESGDFTVLPEGEIIFVRVRDTNVIDLEGKHGPWQKLEFEFDITGVTNEDYKDAVNQYIWGSVPFRFTDHPDNKLKQWTEALFGLELEPGFELDTSDFIGREARAIISNYDTRNGDKRHQVDALLPLRKGQEAPTPTEPEDDPDHIPF